MTWLRVTTAALVLLLSGCSILPPTFDDESPGQTTTQAPSSAPLPALRGGEAPEAAPVRRAPEDTLSLPAPQTPAPFSAPGEVPSEPSRNAAVVALLGDADSAVRAGRPEAAAATLERALRLEPGNAMLWHRLAALRLEQGQWNNAASLAAKSNALAGKDLLLQAQNWTLIARARDAGGDQTGAAEARRRAHALAAGR